MDGQKAVSIRLEKIKDVNKLVGQYLHDVRRNIPAYVDPSRIPLNLQLFNQVGDDRIQDVVDVFFKKYNIRKRKDSVLVYRGIITFSKQAQKILEGLSDKQLKVKFLESLEALSRYCGGVEYLYAVWHKDETATHLHFLMLPFSTQTRRSLNKTVFSEVRNGKRPFSVLQDVIGKVWEDLGITRGKPKAQRIADGEPWYKVIHRSVRQLHEDLLREIEEKRKEKEVLERQVEVLRRKVEYLRLKVDEGLRVCSERSTPVWSPKKGGKGFFLI